MRPVRGRVRAIVLAVIGALAGTSGVWAEGGSFEGPNFAALCRDDLGYGDEGWGYAVCLQHQRMIWQQGPQAWQGHIRGLARARRESRRDYRRFQDRPAPPGPSGAPDFFRLCRDEYGHEDGGWGLAQCVTRQRSLWNNDRELWRRQRQAQAEFVERRRQAAPSTETPGKAEPSGPRPNFSCYCEKGSGIADGTWAMAVCRQHQEMLWRRDTPSWIRQNRPYDSLCR